MKADFVWLQLCMVLVYRYAFLGPKFTIGSNDVPTEVAAYNKVFCNDEIQIEVLKHKETQEASGTKWETFGLYSKNVLNAEIFQAADKAAKFDVGPLTNPSNKYIAFCDVQKMLETLKIEICASNRTVEQQELSIFRAMMSAQESSITINYELPLNLRFFERLSEAGEKIGFVISKTLPQDSMTVFGKSQPDISIYRAGGDFIAGTTVVGATLSDGSNAIVKSGSIELKKYCIHHKSLESTEATQTLANMVRLAGFLTTKALEKGIVVEKVNILGLLASHISRYCIPFKYTSECISGVTTMMKGDEILLPEALDNLFCCI